MFAAKYLAVLSVLAVASAAPCKEVSDQWDSSSASASDVAASAGPTATSQLGYGAAAEVSAAYSAAASSASSAAVSAAPAASSDAAVSAAAVESSAAARSSAAPAAASSASSGSSASSPASGSSSGKATYYAVGLGACGWTNSDSEYVVAMNAPQYSSGTCGQNIQITNPSTGKTQTAKIVDLCPGCSNGDLDMSPTLFSYLNDGNMDAGVFQMTWSYA